MKSLKGFLFFSFLVHTHLVFAQTNIQVTNLTVSDALPNELQNVTYTITIRNNGPQATTTLRFTDLLPGTMQFVSAAPAQGTYDALSGIWDVGALASGQNRTLSLVAYPKTGTSGTTVANTASYLSSTPADNNSSDNSRSVSITINQPDISVTKTINDATPDVGQTVLYTVKAKNIGLQDAPATGLAITDLLPSGLTYVPGSSTIPPGSTYTAVSGLWTIGTLNDNVELTLILAATVNAGQTGATMVNNASVSAIDQSESNTSNNSASVSLTVNYPDIQITKSVSAGPYNENTNLTFTVTVRNNGPITATNVVVKDDLASGFFFVSASATQGTYSAATDLWTVGTLASGVSKTLTLIVQPVTGTSGTALNNTASLYSMDQNDPAVANNIAHVEIEVATVDLSVVKTVNDASPDVGQTITFSVLLNNTGPGIGTNIVVKDILPPGLTFIAFTQTPAGTTATHSSGAITWSDPTMSLTNQTLKFTASVDAGYAAKTITNTAFIDDFQQVDPNSSNNTSSISLLVNGADLALTKTVNNQAPAEGNTIIYTIKVKNNGPLAGNDVVISDLLPAGVNYVSHTVNESTYNPVTGIWGGTNLDLAIGEERTLAITATVNAGTNGQIITNTASITSQSAQDGITENNTSSVFFVVGNADVGLTKTVNGSVFSIGDLVTYTLTVTNNGPFQAAGFYVSDVLPASLTYSSSSATLGSYSNATGRWTFGSATLAVGSSATLTLQATVKAGTAAYTIINTASLTAVQGGNNPANDAGSATFKVHGADIAITKTASAFNPVEGSPLAYTLTVTNNGPDATTGLVIKDLIPANLDFVSATGGTYSEITGEWTLGNLSSGSTAVLTINTQVENGGGISNTAFVFSSSAADDMTANNSSSVFVSALKTFTAGACIINMGQLPQTYNNTLKAYGLVYTLVATHKIPVWWAIRPDKSFENEVNKVDEVDFTVNGVSYKTGAFVIDAEYASLPEVQAVISEWTSLYPALQVNCGQPAFNAPINDVLTSMPRAVLDEQNGHLIKEAFYDNIGLTNQVIGYNGYGEPIYSLYRPDGYPSNLDVCDDIYAMPHADPHLWNTSEKETFDAFVKNGGWIWLACHAPSSLETLVDVPSVPGGAPDMNYLSEEGLVLWGDHDDGTPPYSYSMDTGHYAAESASDPFMQFIGNIDAALQSGSEQIYIPLEAGWRPSTTIAIYDPDHPQRTGDGAYPDNAAALVAYGHAFGNPDYGMVVYQASHNLASGTEAENVGSARIYGNFWFQAGIEFKPTITPVSIPGSPINAGQTVGYAVTVHGETPTVTCEWSSSCGGTFSDPNSPTTNFTAPAVADVTQCIIRCVVSDECDRWNFFGDVIILNPITDVQLAKVSTPDPVLAGEDITYSISVVNNGPSVAKNVSVNDLLPAGLAIQTAIPDMGTWSSPVWTIGDMTAGQTANLTIVARVNSNAGDGSTITNTATATTTTPDNNIGNNSATVVNTVNTIADVYVTKTLTTSPVVAGQQVKYTLVIGNNGPSDAVNVVMTDENLLLSSLEYSMTGLSWLPFSGSFTVASLHPGEFTSLYLRGTLISSATGTLNNTASVQSDVTDNNPGNNSDTESSTINTSADLEIVKICNTSPIRKGYLIEYSITVTNHGPSVALAVSVADVINPSFISGAQYSIDGGSSWPPWTSPLPVGTMLVDATFTFLIRGTVVPANGTIVNTATVSSSTPDPNSVNNSSTVSNTIGQSAVADLSIVKTGPASVTAGNIINWGITVTNNDNNYDATNVTIYDNVNTAYVSSPQYSTDGGLTWPAWTGSYNLGTLNSGLSVTILLRGTVLSSVTSNVPNTATVGSSTSDPNMSNNTSSTSTPVNLSADLRMIKTLTSAPIIAGQTITWNLEASNLGPSDANLVVVVDDLPAGLNNGEYSTDNGSSWHEWPMGDQISLGTMTAGNILLILIRADLENTNCGPITNAASVSSSVPDPDDSNNSSISGPHDVLDQTPPSLSCIPPVSVNCSSEIPAHVNNITDFIAAGGSVSDYCSNPVTVAWVEDIISDQSCPDRYTLTRTYRAIDTSDNVSECEQIITVNNQASPAISCPADVNLECASQVPSAAEDYAAFEIQGGTVTPTCGEDFSFIHVSDVITNQSCANRFNLERTYQVIDECGNSAACQQHFIVYDDTPATFDVPGPVTLSCEQNHHDLLLTGTVTNIVGNCGGTNQEVEYSDSWMDPGEGCNGTGLIERTWIVTDQCGNAAYDYQYISITDDIPPEITCPTGINIPTDPGICSASATISEPTASDNCSVGFTFTGKRSDDLPLSDPYPMGTTIIEWTTSDGCGNPATCSFEVTVTNALPVAVNDEYVMLKNTVDRPSSLTGIVIGNDYDAESQSLNVISWGSPAPGGCSLLTNNQGIFTYTPPLNFTGIVSFPYSVCDNCNQCTTATVTIHVESCLEKPIMPGPILKE